MKHLIDAIYKNGTFRPVQSNIIKIAKGTHVRITVDNETEPESLKLAVCVYDGIFDEVERIALNWSNFFGIRSTD